jgi:N-methylhydantoinase A
VPLISSELELEYAMPIHVPMVDVHTVGAGGGSIANVNEAGMLQIGPRSAGAIPGPICFGRGGKEPTITDANLILGRLNPEKLLGVDRHVTLAHVAEAIESQVGRLLGLGAEQAAAAILRVANDKMAGAVRLVSLSRGHDPRDFALLAFGGAGPLHAVSLAKELNIPDVLIPARPGLTNAFGCLVADLRRDFVKTINKPLSAMTSDQLNTILDEHVAEGRRVIASEGVKITEVVVIHTVDMQFQGQTHVLNVIMPQGRADPVTLHVAFAEAYWKRFRVALPEIKPVVVNLNTSVVGKREALSVSILVGKDMAPTIDGALTGSRRVWFEEGWMNTPIYQRDRLPLNCEFVGPAILEQLDATTVVEPGDRARIDAVGNLVIKVVGRF